MSEKASLYCRTDMAAECCAGLADKDGARGLRFREETERGLPVFRLEITDG